MDNGEIVKGELAGIKPILRPLSDLTKEIDVNGEKHQMWLLVPHGNSINDVFSWQYKNIKTLFEWHFDVFGLIENGLAIDINSLVELNGSFNSH